jgi:hypothetical protein
VRVIEPRKLIYYASCVDQREEEKRETWDAHRLVGGMVGLQGSTAGRKKHPWDHSPDTGLEEAQTLGNTWIVDGQKDIAHHNGKQENICKESTSQFLAVEGCLYY